MVMMIGIAMLASMASAGSEKGFKKSDMDGDGKVSLPEYTARLKRLYEKKGKEGYEEKAKKQFKKMDADQDGFLTLEEFKSGKNKDKSKKED